MPDTPLTKQYLNQLLVHDASILVLDNAYTYNDAERSSALTLRQEVFAAAMTALRCPQ
jgi:hypothetical protein